MNTTKLPDGGKIFIVTGINGCGKTRWLADFATSFLDSGDAAPSGRLLCLSGTVLDKFPFPKEEMSNYIYLGRRTNSNMFSEISPYRSLINYLLVPRPLEQKKRAEVAFKKFKKIGVDSKIEFQFRRGRNTKSATQLMKLDAAFDLNSDNFDSSALRRRLEQVKKTEIHLSGVKFRKNEQVIDLMDFSSGERSYIFSVLALAFCAEESSTILFDEPENSLHPSWQESIMPDMWDVISTVTKGKARLVVATHSPLIAASASNEGTYLINLEDGQDWKASALFGNSSDATLNQQFGLKSPRSLSFLRAVQRCLNAVVLVNQQPDAFKRSAEALKKLNVHIAENDPLYKTVQDIFERLEALG